MPEKKTKKTKKSKEQREAEAAAKAKAEADELTRKRLEEEAAAKARAEKLAIARAEMLQMAQREGLVRGDDSVGPYEIWNLYEGTKAAIWRGNMAGVPVRIQGLPELIFRFPDIVPLFSRPAQMNFATFGNGGMRRKMH